MAITNHVCCPSTSHALHAPLNVIHAIVEAHPGCSSAKESSFKRLPIHVACQFAVPMDVIEYLVREYMTGTLEPDILGRLPIHYACCNGAFIGVVKTLLRVNPASTLYADYDGWLPLHVAVHFGASTEVICEMVRLCPASVTMKTRKESTALTLADKVKTRNREEVIKVLKGAPMVAGKSGTK